VLQAEADWGRWSRVGGGIAVLAGLAGLLLAFQAGVVLLPWDSAAATAFFQPDPVRFALAVPLPYRALAIAATLALALALLAGVRTVRAWQAYILAIALLSTSMDRTWVEAAAAGRLQLLADLRSVRAALATRSGALLAVVDDANVDRTTFLWLEARPHMLMIPPADNILAWQARPYDLLLVQGRHPLVGETWAPIFTGGHLSLFERPKAPTPAP
jgi:hypothetical protein